MSDSEPSRVFMFDPTDPEMQAAQDEARANFRYFWREIAWERRRIVPGLDFACIKAPFSDGENSIPVEGHPGVEQMWLGDVDFDGRFVSGTLLNAPNWLQSVKQGDTARLALAEITDWMYAIGGEAYGGFTVNLMRSRMAPQERKEHDNAWGLKFGDAKKIRLVPQKKNWFGKEKNGDAELEEHPMSEAMGPKLAQALAQNPPMLNGADDKGWTLLHHQALAGSLSSVQILLNAGADPNVIGADGATPLQLAQTLGWQKVAALLAESGAGK